MNYRKIGTTGVQVSDISFGCWTMGGPNWAKGSSIGWGDVKEDEVIAAIKVGLDAGVNHFDNADVYGNGRAERMLAHSLDRLGVKSGKLVIATKVGWFQGTAENAYEPAHIRHQCEQSLINLQRDHIDIYYFHHGNFGPGDKYLAGAVDVMHKLVKEGKVRLVGLSAYSEDDFERLVPVIKPQVLQSWANALDDHFVREGSRVDRLMEKYGLSFVAFSPLAQGLLLDKFDPKKPPVFEPGDHRQNSEKFSEKALAALAPKIGKLKARFGSSTEDLASMALNYLLSYPKVCCAIPGFRNERQAKCNVAGAGKALTPEDVQFIREILA